MDMGVHRRPYAESRIATLLADFSTTKPEFRRKETPTAETVPAAVHFIDRRPKLINWAIFDSQRQKDRPMSWEVFVELRQSLEEAAPPCPAPAPLAEGAETPVAGVSRP